MYHIVISGIPKIDKDEFLNELSQHGDIESLEIDGDTAIVTVQSHDTAQGILNDYGDRYLRGVPVTAKLISN